MSRAPTRATAKQVTARGSRLLDAEGLFAPRSMFLECVVTCVDHADILAHTLPLNQRHCDRLVVVTAPEDKRTQQVCRYWNAPCVLTDVFRTRWGEFRKGEGINEGLAVCSRTDWLMQMDTDIVLPPVFRSVVEKAKLDPSCVYGCDRAEFKTYRDWMRYFDFPALHTDGGANCFVDPLHHGQRLGTRLHFGHKGGFVPLGFLQLWNVASGVTAYKQGHTDAAREDNEFSCQWPRAKRGFLPEVIVYHLESEPAPMAVNWKGRKTKPFTIDAALDG